MYFAKLFSAFVATVLLVGTAAAEHKMIGVGYITSLTKDGKSFVIKDSTSTEFSFRFGDGVTVNREGKGSKEDLKVGDLISVCYEKEPGFMTAHYILVAQGSNKNSDLMHGMVKSVNADKKEITITYADKRDVVYPLGTATVHLNKETSKLEDVKKGDHALLIVNKEDGKDNKVTLQSIMLERKK